MMRFIEKFGWRKLLKFGKILIINELWIAFKDTNSLILALIQCIHLTQNRTAPLWGCLSDGPLNRCIVFHYSILRKDHILLLRFAIELRETRSNIYFIKSHIYSHEWLVVSPFFLSSHSCISPRSSKKKGRNISSNFFHQIIFMEQFVKTPSAIVSLAQTQLKYTI